MEQLRTLFGSKALLVAASDVAAAIIAARAVTAMLLELDHSHTVVGVTPVAGSTTTTGSAETSQTTSTTVMAATAISTGPQDRTLAAEVVSIGEPIIEPPEPTLFRDETTVLPGVNDGFPVSTQDAPDGLQARNHNEMRGKRP